MAVIGWDVGGAHLKGARVDDGRVTRAVQVACPLWQGLDKLTAAFAEAELLLGEATEHAVTMTGELSDIFASRDEGVRTLARFCARQLSGVHLYSARGWLEPAAAEANTDAVGSANWHATASYLAGKRGDALFVDMGSTTTDIIPIAAGKLAGRGLTDAERLAAGELVYTGATRTFLMAVAQRVPFRGAWVPVMNEYFGSMADVHRIRGKLPDDADRLPAADNRDKSLAASRARLARGIGRDASEAEDWEWRRLADFYAEAQLRALHDAALQVLSAEPRADDAPVVAAGTGRFVVAALATRLGRHCEPWEAHIPADANLAAAISDCAPAVAVALLFSS